MNNNAGRIALVVLLAIPFIVYFLMTTFIGTPKRPVVQKYFPITADFHSDHTKEVNDTLWHIIPPFTLLDQDSTVFTEKDLEGQVYIADFVFTTCPGICPVMTKQMARVQKRLAEDENLLFITHTVDPERDTPRILKRYARRFDADLTNWKFLTGTKKELYDLSKQGYRLGVAAGDEGSAEEFDHSGRFVLVDRDRIVRGYYDGTDSISVNKLMFDTRSLQLEYYERDKLEFRPGQRPAASK